MTEGDRKGREREALSRPTTTLGERGKRGREREGERAKEGRESKGKEEGRESKGKGRERVHTFPKGRSSNRRRVTIEVKVKRRGEEKE